MILFRISDCLTLLFVFFVWLQWMINFRIHMKILFTTNMKRWQKVGGAVEAHRKECFKRHRNIIETFRCVICNLRLSTFNNKPSQKRNTNYFTQITWLEISDHIYGWHIWYWGKPSPSKTDEFSEKIQREGGGSVLDNNIKYII